MSGQKRKRDANSDGAVPSALTAPARPAPSAAAVAAADADVQGNGAGAFDLARATARAMAQLRACVMHPDASADGVVRAAAALRQLSADVTAFAALKRECPEMFAAQRIAVAPVHSTTDQKQPQPQADAPTSKRHRTNAAAAPVRAPAAAATTVTAAAAARRAQQTVLCSVRLRDAEETHDTDHAEEGIAHTGRFTLVWVPVTPLSTLQRGEGDGDGDGDGASASAVALAYPQVRVNVKHYQRYPNAHSHPDMSERTHTYVFADAFVDADDAGAGAGAGTGTTGTGAGNGDGAEQWLYFKGRATDKKFVSDCVAHPTDCPRRRHLRPRTRPAAAAAAAADADADADADAGDGNGDDYDDESCNTAYQARASGRAWHRLRRVLGLSATALGNAQVLEALLSAAGCGDSEGYHPPGDGSAAYERWAAQCDGGGGARVLPVPALHALVAAYAADACCGANANDPAADVNTGVDAANPGAGTASAIAPFDPHARTRTRTTTDPDGDLMGAFLAVADPIAAATFLADL